MRKNSVQANTINKTIKITWIFKCKIKINSTKDKIRDQDTTIKTTNKIMVINNSKTINTMRIVNHGKIMSNMIGWLIVQSINNTTITNLTTTSNKTISKTSLKHFILHQIENQPTSIHDKTCNSIMILINSNKILVIWISIIRLLWIMPFKIFSHMLTTLLLFTQIQITMVSKIKFQVQKQNHSFRLVNQVIQNGDHKIIKTMMITQISLGNMVRWTKFQVINFNNKINLGHQIPRSIEMVNSEDINDFNFKI